MKKGFTLVELMIVVVIISIVATFAVLLYDRVDRTTRINNAVVQMSSLLRFAGQQAAFRAIPMAAVISAQSYHFVELSVGQRWQRVKRGPLAQTHSLPHGTIVQANAQTIYFSPGGESTPCQLEISDGATHYKLELHANGEITQSP